MIRLAVTLCALAACTDAMNSDASPPQNGGEPSGSAEVRLEPVASGLRNPVHLTSPTSDTRLFVVEQHGRIRIVQDGRLLDAPFLDITDRVGSGGERGLLSVAFHPNYGSNGFFYVNYTDREGDTRIERYSATEDRNRADPSSAKRILTIEQPFGNHNGGLITFGPDGMLYIGMGDGGSGGDPQGHGQNRNSLLGALLRIDVNGGDPYTIPLDNPFVQTANARPEIWAYGLRNPWRWSFDREAGMLYVADVGQNAWEEINVVPARDAGLNYGWNVMEGDHCFRSPSCDRSGLVTPALEYPNPAQGCSVTGGYVYRGQAIPSLRGHYFYGDFCGGWVRSFRYADGAATEQREWEFGDIGNVLSFGEDSAGELYVLSANGRVYRMVAQR
jgi:glucose/arabinose dehydrogenase